MRSMSQKKINEFPKEPLNETSGVKNLSKFRITVELLGFLYQTAATFQSIVTPDLYLQKVCAVNFNINKTLCDPYSQAIRNHSQLSDRIQTHVSTLNIYGALIENIPPIFLMLILLKWSDSNGRKPLMIAPIVGGILWILVDVLNYYCESSPAEYLLMGIVPFALTGGRGVFFLAIYRYLIDITTEENRTWRMSLLAGTTGIAIPIANFISGYIYVSGGYLTIWITSLCLYACAILNILIGFRETRLLTINKNIVANGKERTDKRIEICKHWVFLKNTCKDIMKNLSSSFRETLGKRQGNKRACIWLLVITICILSFVKASNNVGYLFTRKVFGWDASTWSLYMTCVSFASVIGTLVILPILSGFFKVKDGIIVLISLLANIGTNLVTAFPISSFMFQLSAIGFLLDVYSADIVARSIFSKMLTTEEISSIFSVLGCFESVIPLLSTATSTLIYQATIGFFPGCFFLAKVAGNVLALFFFGALLAAERIDLKMASEA